MKTSCLETYFQQLIRQRLTEELESEEVELGFDTMLSHEMIQFLTARYNHKPLPQRVRNNQNPLFMLDEHELAML